jgi:hypothetical protein
MPLLVLAAIAVSYPLLGYAFAIATVPLLLIVFPLMALRDRNFNERYARERQAAIKAKAAAGQAARSGSPPRSP